VPEGAVAVFVRTDVVPASEVRDVMVRGHRFFLYHIVRINIATELER
jgi:hypothetical protein